MVKQFSLTKLALMLAITLQFSFANSYFYPEKDWVSTYKKTCKNNICKKRLKKLFEAENKFYNMSQKDKGKKILLKRVKFFMSASAYREKLIDNFYNKTKEEECCQKIQARKLYKVSPFSSNDLLEVIKYIENNIEKNT